MRYAIINNISWLNELVPTTWPESHELDENEQIINQKTFAQYLVYPSGRSLVKTCIINEVAAFLIIFSRKGYPVSDNLVDNLNSPNLTFIEEEEFKNPNLL